jgi:putative ABC transport system ATP-binding protein
MDTPSSGTLLIGGREVQHLTEAERTRFRREQIGFVFQHFGLLPTLNVAENVALPLLFSRRRAGREIDDLLERVGLQHRRDHRPNELSGGEMQRVAIARALIHRPSLLLADEPLGNLDTATGESITALFQELHANGLTIIVVTHDVRLAAVAQRRLCLRDGQLDPAEAPQAQGEFFGQNCSA